MQPLDSHVSGTTVNGAQLAALGLCALGLLRGGKAASRTDLLAGLAGYGWQRLGNSGEKWTLLQHLCALGVLRMADGAQLTSRGRGYRRGTDYYLAGPQAGTLVWLAVQAGGGLRLWQLVGCGK